MIPGALDPITRLVLTNAIYFKGTWTRQFDAKATRDAAFHLAADKKVPVPMMYQKRSFRYAAMDGVQVLELPYTGDVLSMVVLLPEKADGLPALERQLSQAKLAEWKGKLQEREIGVHLPRFKAIGEFKLKPTLEGLGMTYAFSERDADFSGMTGKRDLMISEVVHKAVVEVNEREPRPPRRRVIMKLRSAPRQLCFLRDHPFVFLIQDNRIGSTVLRSLDPVTATQ